MGSIRGLLVLKVKANQCGWLPRLRGNVRIFNKGKLKVGDHLSVSSKPVPVSITVNTEAELKIGNNVFINYGVDIGCTSSVIIGNNVKIGPFTNIIDSNFHQIQPNEKIFQNPITISDNVWIGRQCIILPGVRVGKNSVIASGSVVTKDIPDNVLVAGVPARIIRELKIYDGWVRT